MSRCQRRQTTVAHIDKAGAESAFFANWFSLVNPELSYMLIKRIIGGENEDCTYAGNGCTVFPLNTTRLPIFQSLLQMYKDRDNNVIQRIVVQETGVRQRGLRVHDYGPTATDTFRIVINLRPPTKKLGDGERPKTSSPVGIQMYIGKATSMITSRYAFGTVLPEGLTNISIFSGETIPGTRLDCAHSLFVIFDVSPSGEMRANVADRLCAVNPIKPEVMAERLEKEIIEQTKNNPALSGQSHETDNVEDIQDPMIDTDAVAQSVDISKVNPEPVAVIPNIANSDAVVSDVAKNA